MACFSVVGLVFLYAKPSRRQVEMACKYNKHRRHLSGETGCTTACLYLEKTLTSKGKSSQLQ